MYVYIRDTVFLSSILHIWLFLFIILDFIHIMLYISSIFLKLSYEYFIGNEMQVVHYASHAACYILHLTYDVWYMFICLSCILYLISDMSHSPCSLNPIVSFLQRQEHHPCRPRMLPADDRNEPEDEVESHYWESLEVWPQG